MRRRDLLATALVSVAFRARAQAGREFRVGVLTPSDAQWDRATFIGELARRGLDPSAGLTLDVASADGTLPRLAELARDLVALRPDVLIGVNSPGTKELIAAGTDIPIVAAIVGDPLALGFVDNLARPGGRVTGVANLGAELTVKRLTLLKDIVPGLRSVALFFHPDDPVVPTQLRQLEEAAIVLDLELLPFPLRTEGDIDPAIDGAVGRRAGGILRLVGQGLTLGPATARRATARGLPSMLVDRASVVSGGLASYVADYAELWRRVAGQVDRILRGTPVSAIPVEQPTKFELVVNLATARRLGLTLPPGLLALADEIIE